MLVRRNAIVMFMCVELMLNAGNLAFVAFSRMHGHLDGQVVAFFTMVVAACEVVVGLAIIMTIFRTRRSARRRREPAEALSAMTDIWRGCSSRCPLAGAAVLLLGGRRTDPWGHLLGCATALAVVRRRRRAVRRPAGPLRRGPRDP